MLPAIYAGVVVGHKALLAGGLIQTSYATRNLRRCGGVTKPF